MPLSFPPDPDRLGYVSTPFTDDNNQEWTWNQTMLRWEIVPAAAAGGSGTVTSVSVTTANGISGTVPLDVTGLTFTLEASPWYKLEVAYRYTSLATAGFNINLLTTGTFQTVETFSGSYGAVAKSNATDNAYPSSTTRIFLRGANGAARTNAMGFATIYFKTNASGTGKIAICRDGAGSEGTLHETVAVLSPF